MYEPSRGLLAQPAVDGLLVEGPEVGGLLVRHVLQHHPRRHPCKADRWRGILSRFHEQESGCRIKNTWNERTTDHH